MYRTGDWVFFKGNSFISKIILKLTFGKVNHVGIAYDQDTLFETDLKYKHAVFHNLHERIAGKEIIVIRPKYVKEGQIPHIKAKCNKYAGVPYSIADVAYNALLGWLKDEIRARVVEKLSNKRFMKCDELVARVTYEVTKHKSIKHFEGYTPQRLLEIALNNPMDYLVVTWSM